MVRFPQVAGLGSSETARRFAIGSKGEAAAYLAHDILGPRLIECTRLVIAASEKPIDEILGSPDDMKFRSSMTLFDAVSKREIVAEAIGISIQKVKICNAEHPARMEGLAPVVSRAGACGKP